MSFVAPWMLWGTAAAGIPIAIHLFYRSRYRRIPWAAMSFLLVGMEQTSRRLRFQELLLLLLRGAASSVGVDAGTAVFVGHARRQRCD